jgi:hypothetical protein
MKMEIESTPEIVAIEDVPCRKWNVTSINGKHPASEAHIFTRLLLLPKTLMIEDPDIIVLNGPNPPGQSALSTPATELEDTDEYQDEEDSWSVSA